MNDLHKCSFATLHKHTMFDVNTVSFELEYSINSLNINLHDDIKNRLEYNGGPLFPKIKLGTFMLIPNTHYDSLNMLPSANLISNYFVVWCICMLEEAALNCTMSLLKDADIMGEGH